MFEFHADRKRYFDMQYLNAKDYVLPFIEQVHPVKNGMRVLEIGAGEGGVLSAFIERGCQGVGVELDPRRVEWACGFLWEAIGRGQLHYVEKDIYQTDLAVDLRGPFDIIVLKDVIEHIHDQSRLMGYMKKWLAPGGVIFFGFPPWQMPFGGHQQIARSFVGKLPYIHLLPRFLYKFLLTVNKEPVAELLEIRDTRISIERFERICREQAYRQVNKQHYLINPIYQWKFGLRPKRQWSWLSKIPYFRNFVTTCVYYLISPAEFK
ncbi:MAG: methyltransferase domain-containing protein [Chitinophagales bacterium]|jgi:SAM-dependent methyltransferase|nr:class I SAM-dependent methyltransferase [Bacteroidota bacterium]NBR36045.1 methyltransferase domain-containing protein [Chitinophagales bacterium]